MPTSLIIRFLDLFWVGECPVCHQQIKGKHHLFHKDLKEKYRWYEISDQGLYCPHCNTRVGFDDSLASRSLLVLPLIMCAGIFAYLDAPRYMEGILGVLGLGWFFFWSKRRKLVATKR